MKRREFALTLASASLLPMATRAAGEPVEGRQYTKASSPQPVLVAGKSEVIEFFGYWCPHCSDLEPSLEAWARKLPADVNFRRIPVAWQAMHQPYQQLYYALEALGVNPEFHGKVFRAVHGDRLRLDTDAGLAVFAAANGLDKTKLADVMKSFTVASKCKVATQAFRNFGLDGVPSLVVDGRYVTSPALAGGDGPVFEVVDALMRKGRAGR
jgi:thiol:disulfide interchange protein DsbA